MSGNESVSHLLIRSVRFVQVEPECSQLPEYPVVMEILR